MKKRRLLLFVFPIIALVLEALPYGAVLNFANPEGEPWRKTFSYFDPITFGYANFGPMLTAILTVVLFILVLIYFIKGGKTLYLAVAATSGATAVCSLTPILYGFDSFSLVGAFITACFVCQIVLMLATLKLFETEK